LNAGFEKLIMGKRRQWYWLKMKTTWKRRYNLSNKQINVTKFSILRTHRVRQKTKGTTRELPSSNIFQTVIQSCWLVPRLVPNRSFCTWVQGFVLKYAWKNSKNSNFLPVLGVFPFPIFESVWWAPERLTRRTQLIGPIFDSGWRSRLHFFV
jgi:hypothetical protein